MSTRSGGVVVSVRGELVSRFLFTVFRDEVLVTYADAKIRVQQTTAAVAKLHRAIRAAVDEPSRHDPAWGEPLVELRT
jgi:hypothetical protein